MTTTHDRNRATVLAYVAAMNAGDLDALAGLFTPDAEIIGVTGSGSLDFARPVWAQLHGSLNMHLAVEAMVVEQDIVAVRYTETGRWTGPFLVHANPTGRSYSLPAIEWFEMRDGLICRRWGARDSAAQARQLGFDAAA